jgi:hypothetical protein
VNVTSRGRALLMLFLFSDVGELDAPTRIRSGSHLDVAPLVGKAAGPHDRRTARMHSVSAPSSVSPHPNG